MLFILFENDLTGALFDLMALSRAFQQRSIVRSPENLVPVKKYDLPHMRLERKRH